MITVFFTNASGGGFAEPKQTTDGCAVVDFFREQMGDVDPSNYLIKVNGRRPQRSDRLAAGDTVEVLPVKVSGA